MKARRPLEVGTAGCVLCRSSFSRQLMQMNERLDEWLIERWEATEEGFHKMVHLTTLVGSNDLELLWCSKVLNSRSHGCKN